jgi:hypothetical protein
MAKMTIAELPNDESNVSLSVIYGRWRAMRRIIVAGCQGSSKTSLAVKFGRKLCPPVAHLDVLYWRPGWKASLVDKRWHQRLLCLRHPGVKPSDH